MPSLAQVKAIASFLRLDFAGLFRLDKLAVYQTLQELLANNRAELIRSQREALGIDLGEFSQISGFAPEIIASLEKYVAEIDKWSFANVAALAHALRTPTEALVLTYEDTGGTADARVGD